MAGEEVRKVSARSEVEMRAAVPEYEEKRLALLSLYQILDTGADQIYDDITQIAAQIAQTPIALISIVDRGRQWFKSRIGLAVSETPREMAFCAHAILNPSEPLIVADATKDKRFFDNPLVTANPNIRFYFGSPPMVEKGLALGTLCVIDQKPRSLSPAQSQALGSLTRQVVLLLNIRRCVLSLGEVIEKTRLTNSSEMMTKIDEVNLELRRLLFGLDVHLGSLDARRGSVARNPSHGEARVKGGDSSA